MMNNISTFYQTCVWKQLLAPVGRLTLWAPIYHVYNSSHLVPQMAKATK